MKKIIHILAVFTMLLTFFLIFVGALIKSTEAGLSVPDWPTTFGENMFLFPYSSMVGGIFYEHSHRLIASIVGFCILLNTILIQFSNFYKFVNPGRYENCIMLVFNIIKSNVFANIAV